MKTSRLQLFLNSLGRLLMSVFSVFDLFNTNREMQPVREQIEIYRRRK